MSKSTKLHKMLAGGGRCKAFLTLALFMLITLATTGRAKATDIEPFTFAMNSDNESLSVVKYNYDDEELTIPATADFHGEEYPVARIAVEVFKNCTSLKKVTIPASVTEIGSCAFLGCTSLENVIIEKESKLTTISTSAFSGCSSLTSFTIPGSVMSLGATIFNGSGVEELIIGEGKGDLPIPAGFLAGNTTIKKVSLPARVTQIEGGSFISCTKLEEVTITSKDCRLSTISSGAFNNCTSLKSFTIPGSVTSLQAGIFNGSGLEELIIGEGDGDLYIGSGFLYENTTIKKVSLPARVTIIDASSFKGCTNLEEVTITTKDCRLATISSGAFSGCKSLKSFTIPGSVTTLGDGIFSESGLENLTIEDGKDELKIPASFLSGFSSLQTVSLPARVTEIGFRAFSSCTNLAEVTIAENSLLATINDNAFSGCTSLKKFIIPGSVTSLGDYIFSASGIEELTIKDNSDNTLQLPAYFLIGLTSLQTVSLPARVTKIEDNAFYGCINLAEVTIAENSQLATIGNSAFFGCTSLKMFTIPARVTSIGDNAFSSCTSLKSFTIPSNVTTLGSGIFSNSGIEELTIEDGENDLVIYAGLASNCANLKKVSLPARLTSLGDWTFQNCAKLSEVTIAENSRLKEIGTFAFYGCKSLESFHISASVSSIGTVAFDCPVTVAADNQYFSASDGVLFDKNKATLYRCPINKQGAFVIPENVTSIYWGAFMDCSKLTAVIFPQDLGIIGTQAFSGCTSISDVFCLVENPADIEWSGNSEDFKPEKATIIHVLKDADKCNSYDNINATFIDDKSFNVSTYGPLTILEYDDKKIAELQGDFDENHDKSLKELTEDIQGVDQLTFYRSFIPNVYATIMLPFEFVQIKDGNRTINGEFHTLTSVVHHKEADEWEAILSEEIDKIEANTPYIFKPNENITSMTFNNITTISKPVDGTNGEAKGWKLHGVYSKKTWTEDSKTEYGFAGQEVPDDDIKVGDFVLAGAGAWVDPMRCYLTYEGTDSPFAIDKAATVLPNRIRVVLPNKDNEEKPEPVIDDVVTPVSTISETTDAKVWAFSRNIHIVSASGMDYSIIDLSGRTVKTSTTQTSHDEININNPGVYVVVIGGKAFKVTVGF